MPSKRLASLDQPSGRLMRPVQIVETDPFPRVDDRSTCLRKGSIMSQYTIPNLTVVAPNGGSYAYRRYGKDAGIPIVFLQCFRGNLVSLKA